MNVLLRHGHAAEALALYERYARTPADDDNVYLRSALLRCYAALHEYQRLQETFEDAFGRPGMPNLVHFNIILDAIGRTGQADLTEHLYGQLLQRGLKPDIRTLGTVMHGKYLRGDVDGVVHYFGQIAALGLAPNSTVFNILMNAHRRASDHPAMFAAFRRMLDHGIEPTQHELTTLVAAYAGLGDVRGAERVFASLDTYGVRPSIGAYNALVLAYVRAGRTHDAEAVFERIRRDQIDPDARTYNTMMHGFAAAQDIDAIARTYAAMADRSIEYTAESYAILMHFLALQGKMDEAHQVLTELAGAGISVGVYHYTTLISGYLRLGRLDDMQRIYDEMIASGVSPSYLTQALVIMGFLLSRNMPAAELADKVLQETLDNAPEVDFFSSFDPATAVPAYLFTPHLELYGRLGEASKGLEAFHRFFELNQARIPSVYVLKDFRFLRAACALYAQESLWEHVDRLWVSVLQNAKKVVRPYHEAADAREAVAPAFAYTVSGALDYQLRALAELDRYAEIAPLWDELAALGLKFSNLNWNNRLALMAENGELFEAMRIAETMLMDGYRELNARLSERSANPAEPAKRAVRGLYLQRRTISVFAAALEAATSEANRAPADDGADASAFSQLHRDCPEVYKAIEFFYSTRIQE
ncbi:uncharacterized protein V1510DRAFT_422585 [Dipodascopsis tothii]|uniref:uncharacterized protein n=1 Tax=Dipodascopsis tothii TaxID=44089 RepID=UPI0034CDABCE